MPTDFLTDARRILNRRPEHFWPDGVIHHGFRVLLLLGVVVLLQTLFPAESVPDFPTYEEGDVPHQDILAETGFAIAKSDAELAQQREQAAAAVAPVFIYDASAQDSMRARVRRFVAHVDSAAERGNTDAERRTRVRALLVAYGFPVDDEALDLLVTPANRVLLQRALERTIEQELPIGIVSSSDYEDSPAPQWRLLRDGAEQILLRDTVYAQPLLYSRASQYLPASSPPGLAEFQRLALILFFDGSIKLDRARTEAAREQARQAVPVIKAEVVRGERVIAAHEPLREAQLERLDAYRKHLGDMGALGDGTRLAPALGMFMLNLMLLSIFGFLLMFYRRAVYSNARHVSLLAVLIALVCGAAAIIDRTGAPIELVPIAFPALVVAALWDGRMALNMALVLGSVLSLPTAFAGLTPRLLMLLGGSAAALSVRVVRRRAQGLMLGAVIALVYALGCVALGLLRSREAQDIMMCVLWGTANGIASALIAMGFLPLFEAITKITTDQTLLELADLNRPLLKRLSLEASGTYAHSISVANLAEAAARGIDANALLVRVGAYYHDVGKIATPQYFVENQARGRNPHDQIDPRKSAALVRAHVLEGIKFAEQSKLPESIRAFIPEHHGTQTIGFFYDQARQNNPEAELDPADFAYPGPRPQSKETAILMLADSVESAAKVLQEPTPERIRSLVDRIVDSKITQGQLDEAPVTLHDIARIKDQFVAVLNGMYHHRIDYPTAPQPEPSTTGSARTG